MIIMISLVISILTTIVVVIFIIVTICLLIPTITAHSRLFSNPRCAVPPSSPRVCSQSPLACPAGAVVGTMVVEEIVGAKTVGAKAVGLEAVGAKTLEA